MSIYIPESVDSTESSLGSSLLEPCVHQGILFLLVLILTLLSGLSHGQTFSVLLCWSSVRVCLPYFVLTFSTTSTIFFRKFTYQQSILEVTRGVQLLAHSERKNIELKFFKNIKKKFNQ